MEGGGKQYLPVTEKELLPPHAPNETSLAGLPTLALKSPSQFRFAFVDGLRGLAALSIVIFHIWVYEPDPYPIYEYSHWLVNATIRRIRLAVQVLLVISGFVVAFTLRKTWVTPREIVLFLTRRFVRLIPPYWVTIGVIIVVDILCQRVWNLSSPFDGPLSLRRVSAHLTLLWDILGHEALSAGIWTICIEMQFYVVAIIAWGIAQRLVPRPDSHEPRPSVWGLLAVFVPLALGSLFYWRSLESTNPWVTRYLWMFFLGMITWWTLDRTVPVWIYVIVMAIGLAELPLNSDWRYPNAMALATAVMIFIGGRREKLGSWLNWRWLQYLGRISYSLYLIHFPVCHLLTAAGWRWCDDSPTPLQANAILLTSLTASIAAAHLLYTFVEVPANNWSAYLKRFSESPAVRPSV